MIQKIKRLFNRLFKKKHVLNNTKFKWDNEYSFHPAGQKEKDTL